MWKRACLGLLAMVLGTGIASAQGLTTQFQLVDPGLTVGVFQDGASPFFNENTADATLMVPGHGTDALGAFYQINVTRPGVAGGATCLGSPSETLLFYEIERRTPGDTHVIARVPGCVEFPIPPDLDPNATFYDSQLTQLKNLYVDSVNGRLYIPVVALLHNTCASCIGLSLDFGVVMISGLPSLLDITPTFQPATGTVSWVVPRFPDGLPAPGHFQVYAGDLRDLPDFGRAVPVGCSTPDPGGHSPGEFLSILDPLPDPDPGQGSYVIVAVEDGGQHRFGRQHVGHAISGRDPAAFRSCS